MRWCRRVSLAQEVPLGNRRCAGPTARKLVLHADIGTHNMIITADDCLKIIDFEGSSINGGSASSCYEWFSYRPSLPQVTVQTDIFAYGCMLYEIETGVHPYHELRSLEDRDRRIKQLYAEKSFPDVTILIFGNVIQDCWNGDFNSMHEVVQALSKIEARTCNLWLAARNTTIQPAWEWFQWLVRSFLPGRLTLAGVT